MAQYVKVFHQGNNLLNMFYLEYYSYQSPRWVTLAEGNFDFNAAGMLPEKAGRTARVVNRLNKCK
jgi:hypothetical protein